MRHILCKRSTTKQFILKKQDNYENDNLLMMIGVAAMLTAASCKKDSGTNKIITTPGPYTSLSKAFDEIAPKSKSITINAATGSSFYGNSGTRYVFLPNSFINASGAVVTGNVNLEVLECTSKADMIFSKMLTMSSGELLYSGGEISVKATQGGQQLNIRPGYNYTVKMPTNNGAATAGMDFFRGVATPSSAASMVDWSLSLVKDSMTAIVYDGDTIIMTPDSVGFSNIDKFASYSKATIDILLDGSGTTIDSNMVASYQLPEGYLSAVSLKGSSFVSNTMKNCSVPVLKSHFVVCAIVSGDLYGGILSGYTPSAGSTATVTLSKTTPSAFKTLVSALK